MDLDEELILGGLRYRNVIDDNLFQFLAVVSVDIHPSYRVQQKILLRPTGLLSFCRQQGLFFSSLDLLQSLSFDSEL